MSTTAVEDISSSQSSFFKTIYSNQVCLYADRSENIDLDVLKYVQLNLTVHGDDLKVANDVWNITIRNTFERRRLFSFYWMNGTTLSLQLNVTHYHQPNKNFTLMLLDIPGENIDKDVACDKPFDNSYARKLCVLNASNKSHCRKYVGTDYYHCHCNYTVQGNDAGTHYLCLSELDEVIVKDASYEFTVLQKYYNMSTARDAKICDLNNTDTDSCCVDYGDIFAKLKTHPHILVSTNLSGPHKDEFAGFPLFLHIETEEEEDVVHYLIGAIVLSVLVFFILVLCCWLTSRRQPLGERADCDIYCCFHLYQRGH